MHEIVAGCVPMPQVVYADNDPVVVRHTEALTGGVLGADAIQADLRCPRDLLSYLTWRHLIELAEPLAVLLVSVLHFVTDEEDPWAIVNCYKDQVAPGSFVVISHVTGDRLSAEASRRAQAVYDGASAPGVARSREQVVRFLGGLEMVAPGLVDVSAWRPDHIGPRPGPTVFYAGIGRKTRPGRPR